MFSFSNVILILSTFFSWSAEHCAQSICVHLTFWQPLHYKVYRRYYTVEEIIVCSPAEFVSLLTHNGINSLELFKVRCRISTRNSEVKAINSFSCHWLKEVFHSQAKHALVLGNLKLQLPPQISIGWLIIFLFPSFPYNVTKSCHLLIRPTVNWLAVHYSFVEVYILIQLLGLAYGGREVGMEKPDSMDKHALQT